MSTQVRKAIIPAAGFGTRMLPAAKSVPKEMLPILDRPTMQYVIEEAAAAGVTEILLINSPEKKPLESHFTHQPVLEERLKQSGRDALLRPLNELIDKIRLVPIYQHEQRGLGHAVLQAREAAGNEPSLCMLGDTIFSGDPLPSQQLIEAYARFGTTIIGLEEVPADRVSRYGIVGGDMIEPGIVRVNRLVEKPSLADAPSRNAIAARYILSPAIFECLAETSAGKGGEIQLTDALQLLLSREPIHGVVLRARRHDIGNPLDWLKTNLVFAARDPALWAQLRPLLEALLKHD